MIRTLTAIALTLYFAVSCFTAFEEETVLLYLFDEETADEAIDSSDFENHGEAIDTEWTEDGKNGGAMVFDGASSVIEVPHHESLFPGGDELTIEAWFKPASFPGGHPPIARKGSVPESGWGFDTPGGKIRGFVYTAPGDPVVVQGTTPMKVDKWYHLAMVYDGSEIRIYLDGELEGEVPRKGDINQNEAAVWIGKKANESVWLDGTLDELRILNVAITEEQIQEDMEGITFAVEVTGKLTTTWGWMKTHIRR